MVPSTSPGRNHDQSPTSLPNEPGSLSLRTTSRSIRFQPHTSLPSRHPTHKPRQTRQTQHLGITWPIRLVHWTSNGTLPMPQSIHPQYQGRTSNGHSHLFPTQFSNANPLLSRHSATRRTGPHSGAQETIPCFPLSSPNNHHSTGTVGPCIHFSKRR